MTKQHQIFIGIIFFIVILAACNGSNAAVPTLVPTIVLGDVVQTAVPTVLVEEMEVLETAVALPTVITEPATTQPEPATPEPEVGGEPNTVSLTADNNYGEPDVDSYQLSLRFESTLTGADGSVTNGGIFIEGARDVVNNASTFSATATGTADFGSGQLFSFTQVDEMTYFILPNGSCFATQGSNPNADLFTVFVADGGILGDLEGAQSGIPPIETVNDVLTNHYVFNETNLDATDPTTPDVTSVNGDIYLAADGDYVVRIVMEGQGSSTLLNGIDGDGAIEYELNYFDFDEPVAITIPEGCTELPAEGN